MISHYKNILFSLFFDYLELIFQENFKWFFIKWSQLDMQKEKWKGIPLQDKLGKWHKVTIPSHLVIGLCQYNSLQWLSLTTLWINKYHKIWEKCPNARILLFKTMWRKIIGILKSTFFSQAYRHLHTSKLVYSFGQYNLHHQKLLIKFLRTSICFYFYLTYNP